MRQPAIKKGNSPRIFPILCMLIFIAFLSKVTFDRVPDNYPIKKDAKEYTQASYALMTTGMISNDGITPSLFREPFPIFVLAMHMKLFTDFGNNLTIEELTLRRHNIRQINLVNMIYIVPAFFLIWWLTWMLTRSHWVGFFSIYLSWSFYYIENWYLARPLSEYAASLFLLLIACLSLTLFKKNGSLKHKLILSTVIGITFGLFSLTKASAFYVALVAVPAFAILLILINKDSVKETLLLSLTMLLGLSLVVAPWMLRNSMIVDAPMIAARGGSVLLGRTQINEQIAQDPLGAFYTFAPRPLQHAFFEKYLGYDQKDLLKGGKYEKLDRRNAINDKKRNVDAIKAIDVTKDKVQREKAFERIKDSPLKHIISTCVLTWRGIWSFDGGNHLRPGGKTLLSVTLNFLSFVCMLIMPFLGVFQKRYDWLVAFLFAFGYFWIYALFSHFIPRYSAALIPLTVIALIIMASTLLSNCIRFVRKP